MLIAASLPTLSANQHRLKQALKTITQETYTGIDGLLVYKNQQLLMEEYFNGFDASQVHQTRSTFKSITGLIAAIAIGKKLLDPDEYVVPLISTYLKVNILDPKKLAVKVRHLLTMTSGLDCLEMPGKGPYHEEGVDEGPAPLSYALAIPMARKPGDEWHYCNANSFLLGVAISAALIRADLPNINQFAEKYLFEPLGISNYQIYTSSDGFLYAQGNARFLPKDLAKLGLLVLNRGKWQGAQIISAQIAKVITRGEVETHWSWTDLLVNHSDQNARYAFQCSSAPETNTWFFP